jgi:hypothetical protein
MANSAKSLFYSVLFNNFYHVESFFHESFFSFTIEKILLHFALAIWYLNLKKEILSLKGTSHTNSDSEWENENFVKRTNLTAVLLSNLGFRN